MGCILHTGVPGPPAAYLDYPRCRGHEDQEHYMNADGMSLGLGTGEVSFFHLLHSPCQAARVVD